MNYLTFMLSNPVLQLFFMTIRPAEIKEPETQFVVLKGRFNELVKKMEQLIITEDENVVILYSRIYQEVVIPDPSESGLKQPRNNESLKTIIGKLNREEEVLSHVTT